MALEKEIEQKKKSNKKRIKQVEEGNKKRLDVVKKFLDDDLKEKEEMLEKLLKTPQKRPITPKPT